MDYCCESPFYGPPLTAACPTSSLLFMSFVDAIFRNLCDVNDPCNRIRPILSPKKEYDFIVVGGNSSKGTLLLKKIESNII
ncbi:hypothetical protein JTB14_021440 [Gonioctena quinquepunctata]|nr:hypothetical protein JTB14_021440 [Gonioctena quinquepunctata]